MSKGLFYPLEIIRGETLRFEFDVQYLGDRIDPSSVTFDGRFARPETITPLLLTITESDTDPYVLVVTYPAEQSRQLTPSTYTWEIKMTDNETSRVTTLFYGTLEVVAGVIVGDVVVQTTGGWVNA